MVDDEPLPLEVEDIYFLTGLSHQGRGSLLTGEKIPHNKGGHCPFRKSQLDSQTFGMAGPTGLWTRYHLGGDLKWLSSTKKKSTSWFYPTLIS